MSFILKYSNILIIIKKAPVPKLKFSSYFLTYKRNNDIVLISLIFHLFQYFFFV